MSSAETAQMALTEFLLARIGEDEAVATAEVERIKRFIAANPGASWAIPHQALTPARVLAECEAKRRIVEWDAKQYVGYGILEILAAVYSDHPDYRDEWRA